MKSRHHAVLSVTQQGWTGINDDGISLPIGTDGKSMGPYDLLLLALGSCLQSTFEDVAAKMKVSWEELEMDISGVKRIDIPTTLKECTVALTVKDAEDEKKLKKAFDIATRYCSVYQTISKVADMDWKVTFE